MRALAALGLAGLLGGCGVVWPRDGLLERYETGGVKIEERDRELLHKWKFYVAVVGPWRQRTVVFTSKPYDVQACRSGDVLTIYTPYPHYWVEPSVQVGGKTLEIRVRQTDVTVKSCADDGAPIYD